MQRSFPDRTDRCPYLHEGIDHRKDSAAMDSEQRYITQNEAAMLCGCDYTTIRRRRTSGHFPGARQRNDLTRAWEIPLADLVAAGLWTPNGEEDVAAAIGRTNAERRLEDMRTDLERVRARNEALTTIIEDHREQIVYLRKALDAALRAMGPERGEAR